MRFLRSASRRIFIAVLCCTAVACNAQSSNTPLSFSISSKTIAAMQHAAELGEPSLLPKCDEVRCNPGTTLLVKAVNARIRGRFADSNHYARKCSQSHDAGQALTSMICAQMLFDQLALTTGYSRAANALRNLIRRTAKVCAHGVNAKTYPNVHIDCADRKNRAMLLNMPTQVMTVGVVNTEAIPLFGNLGKGAPATSSNTWYPTLEVRVNGVPLHMIVDTGSGLTMLNADALHNVGIHPSSLTVGVNDTSTIEYPHHLVSLRNLQVGAIKFTNVPAVVLKDLVGTSIDGVIGLNVLEKIGSFAFRDHQFEIHPTVPSGSRCVPITIGSTLAGPGFRLMFGNASFDGQPVTALLDTGSLTTDAEVTPYFARTHHRKPKITQHHDVLSTGASYRINNGTIAGRLLVLGKSYGSQVAYSSGEKGPVDVVVGARALMGREVAVNLDKMRACAWSP